MFPKLDCISRFCGAKLVRIQFIEFDIMTIVLYLTLTLILYGFFLAFISLCHSLMLSLNRSVNRSLFLSVFRCKADESS